MSLVCLAGIGLLTGCASTDNTSKDLAKAERTLYLEAQGTLDSDNYTRSLELLQALETKYPLGRYSAQALLEQVYAQFKSQDYELARATADRFIRLHPSHPQVDYAYYLRGLSAYMAGRYMLEGMELVDISERDLGATRNAFNDFSQLIQRFPNSRYVTDARQRMLFIRNVLARHEIFIAQFYIRKGGYLAAVNRSRYALENYPTSPVTADALATLTEAYIHLGMEDLARDSLKLLRDQYPDHPQLNDDGEFRLIETMGEKSKAPWEFLIPDVFS
ncbi:outer membrane protein assembly factor BamD [Oceanospirillum beijerinckii]|uniref:outer membrane protein assembly factor BamD n=1 Tax=Oceanospirillum beijerinckii TaxID=64976 RepID=UPI0006869338|nr:outer membrane protein assembly factor BamD [Oceanospirillum beijerinckii]MAC46418.1 outer membrane protein assembly factor BamD [Oceanospirillum sp.]